MITVQIEGRSLVPSADMIAVEQDSGYETLHFEVPEIFPDGQTAYVMFQREDGSTETYMLGADGIWTLTSGLTNVPTKLAVFLRIVSTSGQVWNSYTFVFRVHNNFDITFGTVADDAATLNAALVVMGQYANAAQTAQEDAEEAQEAAEAAKSAALAAQQSAEAAKTSAQGYQQSAQAAKTAAESANASAQQAKTQVESSASAASLSATQAESSAAAASVSAVEAQVSAGQSQLSATQAQESKQSAMDSASTAQTKAAEAASSASAAGQYAQSAGESAQSAANSAQSLAFPGIQVTTLAPGAQATGQWITSETGTTLKLGIPQGQSGDGSGDMLASIYDPDEDGKVEAAEVADYANGAAANTVSFSNGNTGMESTTVQGAIAEAYNAHKILEIAFDYAYTILQAQMRDAQDEISTLKAQMSALST